MNLENEIEAWARTNFPVYEFMELRVLSVTEGSYKCFVPLSDIPSEATFPAERVEAMNAALTSSGRYDFAVQVTTSATMVGDWHRTH
jgi:hypothetical protein